MKSKILTIVCAALLPFQSLSGEESQYRIFALEPSYAVLREALADANPKLAAAWPVTARPDFVAILNPSDLIMILQGPRPLSAEELSQESAPVRIAVTGTRAGATDLDLVSNVRGDQSVKRTFTLSLQNSLLFTLPDTQRPGGLRLLLASPR